MATVNRPYGKVCKGHTIPYGTFSGANPELSHAYYYFGYKNDEDIPPLPCLPMDMEECFDPEEDMQKKEIIEAVGNLLDSLSPRESKVLRLRFGFGCPDFTLEEIGNIFELSRERIRQIEHNGLRKFRKLEQREIVNNVFQQNTGW
jgi:RNA polymerase sigma factor (sigma-70 family)